jgi:allantoin racemase
MWCCRLNQQDHLAGIHTNVPTGGELAADPERVIALFLQAYKDAQAKYKADAVILGSAGLAGFAAKIQPQLSTPIIDSVQAGIAAALGFKA